LSINEKATQSSLAKLSSGYRINSAADDAAGLSISEKMRGQISGLNQASSNAQDGISLIQTAEGALNTTTSILQRMRELSVQAANGTNTTSDNQAMTDEFSQLKSEIDTIGNTTQFNTKNLLDGSLAGAAGVSVGASDTTGAVVSNLAAGKMTAVAANDLNIDHSGATLGTDTLTVDGQKIDVNWNTLLSTDQQAQLQSNLSGATAGTLSNIASTLVGAINTAIDQSGRGVAHISGYLSGNAMVLQSGTTGVHSEVTLTTAATATSIGATMLSDVTGAVSAAPNIGTDLYSGNAVAVTGTFNMQLGGQNIQVTPPVIANNDAMGATATALQTAINAGITAANTTSGKTSGQVGYLQAVTVTATNDGRFDVSSPSGAATFSDNAGTTTAADLGLSSGQTQSGGGGMTFQIGANAGQTMSFGIDDMRTAALGLSGVSIDSTADASNAITAVDAATAKVSAERSKLGAIENRLNDNIDNLGTSSQNTTAAEAQIRDVDMASEMTNFTKNNILQQAAQAMLAQANQLPQGVLQLLR